MTCGPLEAPAPSTAYWAPPPQLPPPPCRQLAWQAAPPPPFHPLMVCTGFGQPPPPPPGLSPPVTSGLLGTEVSGPLMMPPVTSAPFVMPPVTSAPFVMPPVTSDPFVMPSVTSAPFVMPPVTSSPLLAPPATSGPVMVMPDINMNYLPYLTPPSTPPVPTDAAAAAVPADRRPWVQVRGTGGAPDPRLLAVVYGDTVTPPLLWNKSLQLDDGFVSIHVRFEGYTVQPEFPGPIRDRRLHVDANGVQHVAIPIANFGSQQEFGMYLVWVSRFGDLFNQTGHHWALVPDTAGAPKPSQIWRSYSTVAKIRFACGKCGNAWTSMHGQATFHYFLDRANGAGTVLFQLFGQKCRGCMRASSTSSAADQDVDGDGATGEAVPYANPMWYPDEVGRVLTEVFEQVRRKLYLRGGGPAVRRVMPRCGRPQQPHEAALCQACSTGTCRMMKRL